MRRARLGIAEAHRDRRLRRAEQEVEDGPADDDSGHYGAGAPEALQRQEQQDRGGEDRQRDDLEPLHAHSGREIPAQRNRHERGG